MAFLISLSFIISSSTTMRISDALLHAQTENRRNIPQKYLSVFFMKAPLDFTKETPQHVRGDNPLVVTQSATD